MEIILGNKELFNNKGIRVTDRRNMVNVLPFGYEEPFQEMYSKRKPVHPFDIYFGLIGQGYVFANLGISGILTMEIQGENYLAMVRQERKDIGDSVAKLVSGYLNPKHMTQPELGMLEEFAEEVLPLVEQQVIRFTINGEKIGTPYSEIFFDYPKSSELVRPARFQIPGLRQPVSVNNKPLSYNPKILYHAPTNSAQLIYDFHMSFDGDFSKLGVSMYHSEDRKNLQTEKLETILHPQGILLFQLNKGSLTDRVFQMQDSSLTPLDPRKIYLSEAFAPKQQGIVDQKNIPFMDYLKTA